MAKEIKDVNEIIKEIENKRKEALEKIESQLKIASDLYNTLISRLNIYTEEDRQKCQLVYDKFNKIVDTMEKVSPGVLDALNSAMSNLLASTQRHRELLQEVSKTKTKLEEIHSLMDSEKEQEQEEFDMADHIGG